MAKVKDARLLYDHKRYSNSYYLYGYAIEIGLKACIARQVSAQTIPDKAILSGFLDHQIGRLVGLAGLADALKNAKQTLAFDSRWSVVAEWSVDARYDMIDSVTATAMADAVEHGQHGVLVWLQLHW
jgi:hypothetical protein